MEELTANNRVRKIASFVVGITMMVVSMMVVSASSAWAQFGSTNLQGYGIKIFRVESGAYPFV